mgnify:CR=1 FL=1
MNNTYAIPQSSVENTNMYAFQNAFASYRLDLAKETVRNSDDSDVKELTLGIVSRAQTGNLDTMNSLADMIEAWSINFSSPTWISDLKDYCKEKADIQKAYSVMFLQKRQLIVVVDDMANDNVLDYNMFAFELRNNHRELKDFMVIDAEAFEHIKNEFDACKEVYRRG